MILARYNLAAPGSESLKAPALKAPALGILLISALGVSALCGAAVFLFLLAGEQHPSIPASSSASVASQPVAVAKPPFEADSTRRDPATAARTSKVTPFEFEKADFLLIKSRSYQAAGPLRIRLLKTSRKKTCDIAVLIDTKRARRLNVTVGKAIDIPVPGFLPHATLVVKGVAGNRAWGYLIAPKSAMRKSALFNSRRRSA